MQEATENKDFKDQIRSLINSLEFKEKLDTNLVDKKLNKIKNSSKI